MKKVGKKDLKDKYKHLKHHVQKELRHAHWTYIENIVTPKQDDDSFSNMKKFWSYIKNKKSDYSGVSSLKQDGRLISDPKQKSNSLNHQFQSVFSEAINITPSEFIEDYYMQDTRHYPIMQVITITSPGIEKLLQKLDPSKASGPDELKPRL